MYGALRDAQALFVARVVTTSQECGQLCGRLAAKHDRVDAASDINHALPPLWCCWSTVLAQSLHGQLMIHRFVQLTFVFCACLLSMMLAAYFFFRKAPVYLLNFSVYKPPKWCGSVDICTRSCRVQDSCMACQH